MRNTFGKFVLASAVLAAAAFTTIPATAATTGAATVNVPFSFTVHGKSLPAGTYQVRWDGVGNYVTVKGKNAVETFFWVSSETPTTDRRVIMRFEEQGQEHALQSIRFEALTTPQLTPKTKKSESIVPLHGAGR